MRKSIIAMLALVCGLITATEIHAFSNNLTGFYLGPDLGYAVANMKLKYINSPLARNIDDDASIFGPLAGLHAGYQKDTNTMLIGGEIYLTLGSIKGTIKDRNTPLLTIKTTRNMGFGGAFKLGAKINRMIFYGKLAGDFSQFKLKLQDSTFNESSKKYLFGVGPGLGVEGLVSKSLILGAEWTLLMYQSKNMLSQLNGVPITMKIKPMVSEFKIRLSMKI